MLHERVSLLPTLIAILIPCYRRSENEEHVLQHKWIAFHNSSYDLTPMSERIPQRGLDDSTCSVCVKLVQEDRFVSIFHAFVTHHTNVPDRPVVIASNLTCVASASEKVERLCMRRIVLP
jgi:hypothetical protein